MLMPSMFLASSNSNLTQVPAFASPFNNSFDGVKMEFATYPDEHTMTTTFDTEERLTLDPLLGTNCSELNPVRFLTFECYKNNPELIGTLLKAFALSLIIIFTIFGNVLVLMSVAVSRNLRSSTHYLIVNLAIADLLLGTTVLPFSAVFEVTNMWYFGKTFCTIWAAVDVLCCTSSILSLCVISVDRYIGVTRPLAYSTIMFGKRTSFLIVLIWASSILISIGPLFGWKEPPSADPYHCTVNKQVGYVLFSVTGSFYLPMLIIIIVYWKIYKAAVQQTKFLECGQKTTKQDVTLRIHLGGNVGNKANVNTEFVSRFGTPRIHRPRPSASISEGQSDGNLSIAAAELNNVPCTSSFSLAPLARPEKFSTSSISANDDYHIVDPIVLRVHRGGTSSKSGDMTMTTWPGMNAVTTGNNGGNRTKKSRNKKPHHRNGFHGTKIPQHDVQKHHNNHHLQQGHGSQANSTTPSPPSSSPERKLNPGFGKIAKFRRQKKAAKTLAIVVGVFLVCWFPFFFVLPLGTLCTSCKIPDWIESLVFWLGYFNSCLNPVIYGCTSREFQRAFRRILCRRSPPRPNVSRAIYRANMCNNNRMAGERPSGGNNANGMPLHNWS